jgi:hypothetical protein
MTAIPIFVTSYGKNILYHNNGDGTFTDVTAKAGVAGGGWSVSAGFFDYDNDGKLDLFVTRYMDWDTQHSKDCGGNFHTYCPPEEFPRTTNILYHNRGDGTFEDVSQRSGLRPKRVTAWVWRLRITMAMDSQTSLWPTTACSSISSITTATAHSPRSALEAGAALNPRMEGRLSGMGVVFQDYDNDGRPDIIVTTLPRQTYAVFHNDGNGSFSDRGLQTGVTMLSGITSGWGVGLEDFDNDGQKDLFITQGHVLDNVESHRPFAALPGADTCGHESQRNRFERVDSGSDALAGRGPRSATLIMTDGSTW